MTKDEMANINEAFRRWSLERSPERIALQDAAQFIREKVGGLSESTRREVEEALAKVLAPDAFDA